jgi:glycosyltransferase involved in cell wall biosynthesis
MERYERKVLAGFAAVVAVAERDREHFRTAYGLSNVSVIPTGVDLDYFCYAPTPALADSQGGTLVYTASMDSMANIDAVEFFMDEVWPIVARSRAGAKLLVVGKNPPASLVERAKARGLNWAFTGFVDDVRPYVHGAHVYVIPLRVGGGTRIKVYEAMAMGCPVVSTAVGVEGLPVEHEHHFLKADRPENMAAAILSLLANPRERLRLSQQARRFVEEKMSARRTAQAFERVCEQVLRS